MNDVERRKKIKEFIVFWSMKENLDKANEEEKTKESLRESGKETKIGERKFYQTFWNMLLREIFEVEPYGFIEYEKSVVVDGNTKFIDAYIKDTRVLIEQKGSDIDLDKEELQSGGIKLTPAEQARRYVRNLSYNDRARWMVVSNFKEIRIFDMNKTGSDFEVININDLDKEWYRLKFLIDVESEDIKKEMEVSVAAGRLVGELYDALYKQYKDMTDLKSQRSLNILCVRIVFCLYAEDAGLFDNKQMFYEYLKSFKEENFRDALISLFKVLNQKESERDKYLKDTLLAFPYVNGGLFAEIDVEIPQFNHEIIDLILNKMSEDFDWSKISPTIFGAIFESTLNPDTRRSGGMHYTSIENIHKVIDPLFLNDLKKEFDEIKEIKQKKNRDEKLRLFQDKISKLRFLDPAAGSGNFLTETYMSLRKIENEIIKILYIGEKNVGEMRIFETIPNYQNVIKVNIGQFYGIEINDFAVTVANTALWIAEYQMLKETEDILNIQIDYLPLKNYNHIVEGNALTLDWHTVIDSRSVDYIMGNPPFVGARLMNETQKEELNNVFAGWKNIGDLDYVSCWYKKSIDFIEGTNIKTALVSTNSICQGDSVAILWKPLFERGIEINFAYKTFKWNSQSEKKASVFCIIIGFSNINIEADTIYPKVIYENDRPQIVSHINAYLIDADDVFVESRNKPICDVPEIGIGNQPIDNGNYLFTKEEKDEFVKKEPKSEKYFYQWYGADEFINNKPRYCLYLGKCSPAELKSMPKCMERVDNVRKFRLSSKRKSTIKAAEKPTHFGTENFPNERYIVLPEVTTSKRRYIPIGFFTQDKICSNLVKLMPKASLYHFGILTSNVHMAWVRAVCGRLGDGYRYSKDIVYNNFPWPTPTDEQKMKIEETAQGILDARAKFPDSSLADLYDDITMPDILRKAHRDNDIAIMKAYGFKTSYIDFTEEDCVAELMKLYKKLKENEL